MSKRLHRFMKTVFQQDLFPNRETVGQENEAQLLATFQSSITLEKKEAAA